MAAHADESKKAPLGLDLANYHVKELPSHWGSTAEYAHAEGAQYLRAEQHQHC